MSPIHIQKRFAFLPSFFVISILVTGSGITNYSYALEFTRAENISIDTSDYDWSSQSEALFILVSNDSSLVWQQPLSTSVDVRAEIFNPVSGAILSTDTVAIENANPTFEISLPPGLLYDQIDLVAVNQQAQQRVLGSINRIQSNTETETARQTAHLANENSFALMQPAELASPKPGSPTVSTILDNGPSANRIDILLLGDGYTESEMAQWHWDAQAAMNSILTEAPFADYQSYFNVHRIDAVSNTSGVSHPELNIEKDTAFGTYYNCSEIQRLICISDFSNVLSIIYSLVENSQEDIIVMIVNDAEYGGSGGRIAVASTHSLAAEILLHELGHSFGNLADEYNTQLPSTASDCAAATSDNHPNVSAYTDFENIKWKHWLDAAGTIPTPYSINTSDPGFYAGAKYCSQLYRPTPNSKMRSLGRPFDPINEEALVLRLYDFVSAFDQVHPTSTAVNIDADSSFRFEVDVLSPVNHALDIQWYINGQADITGPSLSSKWLDKNSELVSVVVTDNTNKVRLGNNNMVFTKTWNINNSLGTSAPSRFENNIAYLPYVKVVSDENMYRVELTQTSTDPIQFRLTDYEPVNSLSQPENIAILNSDDQLTIQSIEVDGTAYTVIMQLIENQPDIIFQLQSAQQID